VVGAKLIDRLQLECAAITPDAQLLFAMNSPTVVSVKVSDCDSWFVNVMIFGALIVPILCALKVVPPAESIKGRNPVPEKFATCGLVTASSYKSICPSRTPPTVGSKLSDTLQLAPAASVAGAIGHVVAVCTKSPVNWILVILCATESMFFTTTVL